VFPAWQLDALRSAALIGTLEYYQNASGGPPGAEALPVWQALATPIENLQNRAERIAPQVAQAADIASASAVETRSPITASMLEGGGWPSYAVALKAKDGDVQSLERRLSRGDQPVVGRIENELLLLDLRTVFPRQDTALVQAVAGEGSSKPVPAGSENPTVPM
jgi:L-seryl-tRNA(Ser) seleniumtransferase